MLTKWLRSSIAPVLLFALAAVLIGFGGINAVLAAPRIQSGWYGGEAQLNHIDVMLLENGEPVHFIEDETTYLPANQLKVVDRNEDEEYYPLLTNLLDGTDGKLLVGVEYPERLSVKNTQNSLNPGFDGDDQNYKIIDEYVRVTVYRYWTRKENGVDTKAFDLDPSLIDLNFIEGEGWSIDADASTAERTVLYYAEPLLAGQESSLFADGLTIKSDVLNGNEYKDATFHIEAIVDAVQTHSAEEAKLSAWGLSK